MPAVAATPVGSTGPWSAWHWPTTGTSEVVFTLTPNDFAGHAQTVRVGAGHPKIVNWPADADGYYDVTITADTSDGFTRRYAGRIA